MTFQVTNIQWDTDNDIEIFNSLPQELEVCVGDEDDICDALSDAYGYCVHEFDSYIKL
jgi:hypothetical protein